MGDAQRLGRHALCPESFRQLRQIRGRTGDHHIAGRVHRGDGGIRIPGDDRRHLRLAA